MTDCDGNRLEQQAKRLAELLNLPLIDSTVPSDGAGTG